MEQPALMLSSTYAAAQVGVALWSGQLFLIILRPHRLLLAWHAVLTLGILLTSTYAWQSPGQSSGWTNVWLISTLLSGATLVVYLGRWLKRTGPKARGWGQSPGTDSPLVPMTLASVGLGLCLLALVQVQALAVVQSPLVRWASHLQLLCVACLSGVLIAATVELTGGALGEQLLGWPWSRLTRVASIAFLVQIMLGMVVVAKLQPADLPLETAAPVIYSFGLLLLSYIAWCVPRRMQAMARVKRVSGQASLALSGWIGILCFILAGALPPYWPWCLLAR